MIERRTETPENTAEKRLQQETGLYKGGGEPQLQKKEANAETGKPESIYF